LARRRPLHRHGPARGARSACEHSVPRRARARRPRLGIHPRAAADRTRSESRSRHLPAPAPVLGGDHRTDRCDAGQRGTDLAARDWPRHRNDGNRRRRRARGDRQSGVADGVRARRDRGADRRARVGPGSRAVEDASSFDRDRAGREPAERCGVADPLRRSAHGRHHGTVQRRARRPALRSRGGWRRRSRHGCRACRRRGLAARDRHAAAGRDLTEPSLSHLHPGAADRAFERTRCGLCRDLREPIHAARHHTGGALAGDRLLGDAGLPGERPALSAGWAAAPRTRACRLPSTRGRPFSGTRCS